MLTFFPTPYPDELLYSVLARYYVRSGSVSPKATASELFGSSSVTAVVDLPANIDELISNLPIGHRYSSQEFILKNTLYPFYSAFLPPERAKAVFDSMRSTIGGSVHSRVGAMASSIAQNQSFKFCPQCVREELSTYGERYWHRVHQIPGIVICPIHRCSLNNSQTAIHSFNRHEFVPVTSQTCCDITDANPQTPSSDVSCLLHSDELSTKYLKLVDNVDKLLFNQYSYRPLAWFHKQYMEKLKSIGLANIHGRVNQTELHTQFLRYYGSEFLRIVQSPISNFDDDWLSAITRKHRKSFHPIRHLLMLQFLGLTLEELFENEPQYNPFGESPWLCLNPVAPHYLKPVVTDMQVRYDSKIKRPVGTFSCECGFVYARKGPDSCEEDKFRVGRIKAFGTVWENKLKELLSSNLSMREIARTMHADTNTIIKYSKELEIEGESRQGDNHRGELDDIRESKRDSWRTLLKTYPFATKTELRDIEKGLYSWLFRNDRDWLNQNASTVEATRLATTRVDWERRDIETLSVLKDVVENIFNSPGKPKRVTIGRVGKISRRLALLQKHLWKMPRTRAYLEGMVETVKDYQIRRIEWAIREIECEGQELRWWKVMKKAGIRESASDELKTEFEQMTKRAW